HRGKFPLPRPRLGEHPLDVYDFPHGPLSATDLGDFGDGLCSLGDEPVRLSFNQSYTPCSNHRGLLFSCARATVDCHRQRRETTGGLGRCSGCGSSVCLASSSGGIGGLGDRAPRRAFRAVLRVDYSGLPLCLGQRKIPPSMVLVGTGPFPLRDSVTM